MTPLARNERSIRNALEPRGTFTGLRLPSLREVAVAGVFLAAYVALEWISFIHEYKGLPITPWNPGLGAVFAMIVFAGPLGGIVLFAGVVIAEIFVLHSKLDWPIIVGIGAIISVTYTLVATVTRRRLRLDVELIHLRDVLLLLGAGIAGAAIAAVLLTALLIASGPLGIRDVLQASVPLLVGDIIGIAVTTPLLLRFAFRRQEIGVKQLVALGPGGVFYVSVIVAALWAIIGAESADGFKFFYFLFVPVVAAALWHGLDGACLSLAAAQLGLVTLLHLYGYDATAFTEFQTLMFVLTATALIVGVVVSERRNADRLAREAEARLKDREAEIAQAARFSLVSGMASALAHEINQPMTAARALARSAQEILRAKGADASRAEQNLAALIAQIDHAGSIMRRMRDFLRRGQPHFSTIDLRELLDDAMTLVRPEASEKRIELELDVPVDMPSIHGDHIQLQQVILNLVRNAIESLAAATVSQRRIRIVVRAAENTPRIEVGVCDTGPGIHEGLTERLFEPLTTSKQTGLGLGLSICASIIEAHGGRIWLESNRPGATEFRFSLPLGNPPQT